MLAEIRDYLRDALHSSIMWMVGLGISTLIAGLFHLLARLFRKPIAPVMVDGAGLKEEVMDKDIQIVPALVSIHLGIKEGKAQILIEGDLAALAQKEADGSSNAVVKAILNVVAQGIKLIP